MISPIEPTASVAVEVKVVYEEGKAVAYIIPQELPRLQHLAVVGLVPSFWQPSPGLAGHWGVAHVFAKRDWILRQAIPLADKMPEGQNVWHLAMKASL